MEALERGVWFRDLPGTFLSRMVWRALTLLSALTPAQLPLRGFAGRWISRSSACGWRSPQQSASCKTGPSTPRAPREWEQVTPQTGPQCCRNPAALWGRSQRRGVAGRFLLFWGGREGGRRQCPPWAHHAEPPSSAT